MKNDELLQVDKQTRKKPPRPKAREEWDLKSAPGEVGIYTKNALQLAALPKIDLNNAGEVGLRIEEYFRITSENNCRPNQAGLALALGVDRQTVYRIATGQTTKSSDVVETIKKANTILELLILDYMTTGKMNPIPAIFMLKNCNSWSDKSELVITPNNPLGDIQDRAALEAKYAEAIVIDAELSDS